jgi:hypothetical protein
LCNLKEAYLNSKEEKPEKLLYFSKFADLWQKTVLAGASGTHAVCVCTTQQNVKLTISGGKSYDLTENQVKT